MENINSQKQYQIFKLPNYSIKKNDDDTFNCKSHNEPIESILKKLEKDKGYHLRIIGDEPTILFGDLDHLPSEEVFNKFISFLIKIFTIKKEDISFTLSVKENEFSYHWSIPSIEATPKIIKQKLELKSFDEFRAYIDLSIYNKHWFRLPNQTNKIKVLSHKIIQGKMQDFIIHYVDNCDEILSEEEQPIIHKEQPKEQPEKEFIMKLKKGKTKEEYIEKLIDILDDSRADDNHEWFEVSCIINNELSHDAENALKVFENFCKRSDKFIKRKDINWFKSLSIRKDGLKIGSLIDKVKEDNITEYELLKAEFIKEDKKEKKEKKENKENKTEYEETKNKFELNNFKLLDPVGFATIREDKTLILRNKKDFTTVYENLLITNDKKEISFVSEWLRDAYNRTYDKIDFLPMQQAPPSIYNTFKGYEAEKTELIKPDIENSLMLKHIKHLCNNDEVVFNYFIKFLANLIKAPYNISKTAIILKSIQGCGKDTLFDWFGNNILGSDYYINTDKAELIFGRFNSCIENKILIVMNETNGKATFCINENIKCAITAKENNIEHKGKAPYKNTNNIAYVFLTNNDNPLKVPHDDRRFCGIECDNSIANNFEYFTKLNEEINNKSYDRAFFNYLMNVDVNNYDFTNNRPITSFYNNMKELNTPILAKFFENMIDKYNSSTTVNFTASSLYDNFNNFIKDNNFKIEYTSTKFGIDIKNYEGIEKKRTKTGNQIIIDIDQLKQHLTLKYKIEFSNEEFIDNDDETPSSLDI